MFFDQKKTLWNSFLFILRSFFKKLSFQNWVMGLVISFDTSGPDIVFFFGGGGALI